jgi:hypothetical protein
MVQIHVDPVIGYKQIRPPIVVIIRGRYREILPVRLKDLGSFRNVRKRAVPVVVIEHRRTALVYRGGAARLNVKPDFARPLAARPEFHVPTGIEIKKPVAS